LLPRVGRGVAVSGDKEERDYPRYALSAVQARVAAADFVLTDEVRKHLTRKSWDESDVVECFAAIQSSDFHKSQPHKWRRDGAMCDIYKPSHNGVRMYVKFTERERSHDIYILSFCEDGEEHH